MRQVTDSIFLITAGVVCGILGLWAIVFNGGKHQWPANQGSTAWWQLMGIATFLMLYGVANRRVEERDQKRLDAARRHS